MAVPFKAYDIRGIVGEHLDENRAYLIGRALSMEIFGSPLPVTGGELGPNDATRDREEIRDAVVVSRDMRSHSLGLSAALIRGLSEGGCAVVDIGLAATPMNYWANVHYQARGSVMVTASHNGAPYNGFKVSGPAAIPIDYDTGLSRVEDRVLEWERSRPPAAPQGTAKIHVVTDALNQYLRWMDSFLVTNGRPLHIAVDTANGMGGFFLPSWFSKRNWLQPQALYWELDGNFPNHEADPLKPENLCDVQKAVRQYSCDFGASFDGDADRCMFIDENGESISSDLITALIAQQVLVDAPGTPIVYDLRSSRVVSESISQAGGRPIRERVGHTYMKRTLKRTGARFGGELSGHYYFADCFDTDSGLMALVQIINILQASQKSLSTLIAPLRVYSSTGEINFHAPDAAQIMQTIADGYSQQGAQIDELDGLTVDFDDWWFNLRSSNTEPLLRLNLEASSPEQRDGLLEILRQQLFAHGASPASH
jgi:phosphomannomutase